MTLMLARLGMFTLRKHRQIPSIEWGKSLYCRCMATEPGSRPVWFLGWSLSLRRIKEGLSGIQDGSKHLIPSANNKVGEIDL